MHQECRSFIWVLLLSICVSAGYAEDTYNGSELAIPTVIIGAGTYSDVVVVPGTILSVGHGVPNGSADSYDPANGQLFIPSVVVGSTTYTNVTITVKTLISVGSVAGVDTFNGTLIIIPTVQLLNGPVFNTATVTVGRIISAGGGMPENIRDVYDGANRQLTIAAIQYNGKVFTNPVVYVEYATVAGEGIPVPDVVGDTQAAASSAITALGLTVGSITMASSNTVASGNVIAESPPEGEDVPSAYPINLIISSGTAPPLPESVLYSFGAQSGNTDGLNPIFLMQGLAPAPGQAGNLYGTTRFGGTSNNGTVFELTLGGTESRVYTFPSPTTSGMYDPISLIPLSGNSGVFYGVSDGAGTYGGGTLYQLTTAGVETPIYDFCGCIDNYGYYEGVAPNGLIEGSDGDFYGTTQGGSDSSGTVFKIPQNGLGGVLYTFGSRAHDGANPFGNLILVSKDSLFYGVTDQGGTNGTGTVFTITYTGVETVLYSFGPSGGTDAQVPAGALVQATNGNFYGIALEGGANNTGAIYEITSAGVETVLYSFPPPVNSQNPMPSGALIQATDGNLYGVTGFGGSQNYGSIFKMTLAGSFSTLYSFYENGGADAIMPSDLIQATDGNLYGVSVEGGANGTGAIFKYML
jgi:uncharacterized repeat protein (TIGR03803 family)